MSAGLCILFVVISVLIIDKTIRLSMYSNRFIIRSMQLVGTRRFITGPYVKRGGDGILAAVLALVVLGAAVWFIHHKYGYWDMQDKMLTSGFGILALILTGHRHPDHLVEHPQGCSQIRQDETG